MAIVFLEQVFWVSSNKGNMLLFLLNFFILIAFSVLKLSRHSDTRKIAVSNCFFWPTDTFIEDEALRKGHLDMVQNHACIVQCIQYMEQI